MFVASTWNYVICIGELRFWGFDVYDHFQLIQQ